MRLLITLGLVVAASVPAVAASPPKAPVASRAAIVSWRVQSWRPAASVAAVGGLRIEPEGGEPASPDLADLAAQIAARRAALAGVPVRTRDDGSRHAVIGGLVREYTVARIGAGGALTQTCVGTAAQAKQLVAAPARKKER